MTTRKAWTPDSLRRASWHDPNSRSRSGHTNCQARKIDPDQLGDKRILSTVRTIREQINVVRRALVVGHVELKNAGDVAVCLLELSRDLL